MEYFDSLQDFVTRALDTPRANESRKDSQQERGKGWTPQDWAGTLEAYKTGWPDGLAQLEQARRSLLASLTTTQHIMTRRYDVAGVRPHVARAAAGEPLNMVARGNAMSRKRIVRITANIVASFDVKARNMANRGAAVAALVDDLETRGDRVELVAQIGVDGWPDSNQDKQSVSITIKAAQEHLDLDRLAFVFINTGFFRRVWFRYAETFKDLPHGYGRAADRPPTGPQAGIFVPHLEYNEQSKTAPAAAQELAAIVTAYEAQQAQAA